MTDGEPLRRVAEKCRELAESCTTDFAREALQQMAIDLQRRAENVECVCPQDPEQPIFFNKQS